MKKSIAIIGSGPAALMLAATLDEKLFEVRIYEKKFAPARKFLVAGDGGFNLTHAEPIDEMIKRYSPPEFLSAALHSFTNDDLRKWLLDIGIKTFTGSSKRVFPIEGIRPIDVLRAILKTLDARRLRLMMKNTWKGWNEKNELCIDHNYKNHDVKADIVVFALGGGSWAKTGSDGDWLKFFEEKHIDTVPFQPSNCAYEIKWDEKFIAVAEGEPLKNITLSCGDKMKSGELVFTKSGIEGGAVYALSPEIRKQLNGSGEAQIFLDIKPTMSVAEIKRKLSGRGDKSLSAILISGLNLTRVQLAFLKSVMTKEEFLQPAILAAKIKQAPLKITGMAPLDEAISTVGGIALHEVDENFQLKKLRDHYVIGEMLDWDAPTGGYLLQACFSMGHYLATVLNNGKAPMETYQEKRIGNEYKRGLDNILQWAKAVGNEGHRVLFYGTNNEDKKLLLETVGTLTGSEIARFDLSKLKGSENEKIKKILKDIHAQAEDWTAALLLDDGDALLSETSHVQSANDRYASQEIAYLLQDITRYKGLIILSVRNKNNIDLEILKHFHTIMHCPEVYAGE
jgi:uncharacterized flavoprotein (TIGR03862 family)